MLPLPRQPAQQPKTQSAYAAHGRYGVLGFIYCDFSSFLAIADTMCDTAGSDFMRFSHTYHSRAKITHIHFSPLNIFKKRGGNKFMRPQTFIQKYLEISWT